MSVLYVMVPVALALASAAVVAFLWAVQGGQFDDIETSKHRILFEDDPLPSEKLEKKENE